MDSLTLEILFYKQKHYNGSQTIKDQWTELSLSYSHIFSTDYRSRLLSILYPANNHKERRQVHNVPISQDTCLGIFRV
jgi:hypothetical protein